MLPLSTTSSSAKTSARVWTRPFGTGGAPERGLIDTSVVIALRTISTVAIPTFSAVSTLTFAELSSGLASAVDELERARRRQHLTRMEIAFEAVPFDLSCARAFARICSAVVAAGRRPRGARVVDLLIAATALAHELPLYTRNASDLVGLDALVDVIDLG